MITTILYIVQIILGITLAGLVLFQSKNSGVGAVFGGDTSFRTTRRGLEKTLFNLTVFVSVLFFLVAIASVALG